MTGPIVFLGIFRTVAAVAFGVLVLMAVDEMAEDLYAHLERTEAICDRG